MHTAMQTTAMQTIAITAVIAMVCMAVVCMAVCRGPVDMMADVSSYSMTMLGKPS